MRQNDLVTGDLAGLRLSFSNPNVFLRDTSLAPDGPGIYAILVRDPQPLLAAAEYFAHGGAAPDWALGFAHLYTGATYNVRERFLNHLRGEVRSSTLRKSLLAIDLYGRQFDAPVMGCQDPFDEEPLSCWLRDNCLIGWISDTDPMARESEILAQAISPLNISHRRPKPFARHLIALRCLLVGKPVPPDCVGLLTDQAVS